MRSTRLGDLVSFARIHEVVTTVDHQRSTRSGELRDLGNPERSMNLAGSVDLRGSMDLGRSHRSANLGKRSRSTDLVESRQSVASRELVRRAGSVDQHRLAKAVELVTLTAGRGPSEAAGPERAAGDRGRVSGAGEVGEVGQSRKQSGERRGSGRGSSVLTVSTRSTSSWDPLPLWSSTNSTRSLPPAASTRTHQPSEFYQHSSRDERRS